MVNGEAAELDLGGRARPIGGDDASAPVVQQRQQRALATPCAMASRWTLLLLAALSLSLGAAASESSRLRHDMDLTEVITQSDNMSVGPDMLTQMSQHTYWSPSTLNDGRSREVSSQSEDFGLWSLTRLGHMDKEVEHGLQGAAEGSQRTLAAASATIHDDVQPEVGQGCMGRQLQQQQQLSHGTTTVGSGQYLGGNRGQWQQQLYKGQSGAAGSGASGRGRSLSSSNSRRRLSGGPGDDFTENGYDYCISKPGPLGWVAVRLVQYM